MWKGGYGGRGTRGVVFLSNQPRSTPPPPRSKAAGFMASAWQDTVDALKGIAATATVADAAAASARGVSSPPALVAFANGADGARSRVATAPLPVSRTTTAADAVALALEAGREAAAARLGVVLPPAACECECGGGKAKGKGGSASASAGGAKAKARASSGGGTSASAAAGGGKKATTNDDTFREPGGFYQSSKSSVHSLGDATLASFIASGGGLVEFYAPWCGHCKNLKGAYSAAAKKLRETGSTGRLGAVDCTVHQAACSQHGVSGYPTLMFFEAGASQGAPYNGPRDGDAIAAFVADRAPPPPPRAPVQIVDGATLAEECAPASRLCVIAFLPPLLDTTAAERTTAIDALQAAASKFAGRPYAWLWAAGSDHPALERALDVGGYGFPAVVAVAPSSDATTPPRVAHLRGGYEAASIAKFVETARAGGAAAAPAGGALATDAVVAPWDGKDARVVDGAEDEFSLDEIMKDEL